MAKNKDKLFKKFFNIYHHLNQENSMNNKVIIAVEVDMAPSMNYRNHLKEQGETAPCFTAIIAKSITKAVHKHPHINTIQTGFSFWKKFTRLKSVDFSFAVERNLNSGEMVTYISTVRDTDNKDVNTIDKELRSLSNLPPEQDPRWNSFLWIVKNTPGFIAKQLLSLPKLSLKLWKEHRGGALLISSPCKYGGDILTAGWPWPMSFSFGEIKSRPMVIEDELTIRPTTMLTFSFDRRFIPGAPAARFLTDVVKNLQSVDAHIKSSQLNSDIILPVMLGT